MAAYENTALASTGFTGRLGQAFVAATAKVTAWNDKRQTRKALAILSDRELNDIGLSRADIENAF